MAFLKSKNRQISKHRATCIWTSVFLLILLLVLPTEEVTGTVFKAGQIKAAFVYNLANFVTWPEKIGEVVSESFVIAVLDDNEIAKNLEILTRGERIQGKPVVVRRCTSIEEIGDCRILFVGPRIAKEISKELKAVASRSILTVGDSNAFARGGGMVNLIERDKRIQLEINVSAAREAGLRFNSRLLKIAHIIGADK